MSNQPRVAKVLAALLVSMTTGAVVLMALGNNAPSAGPFCLSSYYNLSPVEQAVTSRVANGQERWNRIEIYYSGTKAGNIEQLASLRGLANPEDLNCHFVVFNGLGGGDGQIEATEKWQRQWSAVPGRTWYGAGQTVRVCVIGDEKISGATDYQIKRLEALVELLDRKFEVGAAAIYYPTNWQ